jgi:hypothetical protein
LPNVKIYGTIIIEMNNETLSITTDEDAFRHSVRNDRSLVAYKSTFGLRRLDALNGKSILLVGGGISPVLSQLNENNVYPRRVWNIDPYAYESKNTRQRLLKRDYLTYDIKGNLWDEIWALYSLPCYCKTYDQITQFYKKSLLALAPKGNLRAFPIDHSMLHLLPGGKPLESREIQRIFVDFFNGLSRRFHDIEIEQTSPCGSGVHVTVPENKMDINEYLLEGIK